MYFKLKSTIQENLQRKVRELKRQPLIHQYNSIRQCSGKNDQKDLYQIQTIINQKEEIISLNNLNPFLQNIISLNTKTHAIILNILVIDELNCIHPPTICIVVTSGTGTRTIPPLTLSIQNTRTMEALSYPLENTFVRIVTFILFLLLWHLQSHKKGHQNVQVASYFIYVGYFYIYKL